MDHIADQVAGRAVGGRVKCMELPRARPMIANKRSKTVTLNVRSDSFRFLVGYFVTDCSGLGHLCRHKILPSTLFVFILRSRLNMLLSDIKTCDLIHCINSVDLFTWRSYIATYSKLHEPKFKFRECLVDAWDC